MRFPNPNTDAACEACFSTGRDERRPVSHLTPRSATADLCPFGLGHAALPSHHIYCTLNAAYLFSMSTRWTSFRGLLGRFHPLPSITLPPFQRHSHSSDSSSSLNTWTAPASDLSPASCQSISLACLVILRALSQPLLHFLRRMIYLSSRTYRGR